MCVDMAFTRAVCSFGGVVQTCSAPPRAGSLTWIMKSLITRWKALSLKPKPCSPVHRARKFSAVLCAEQQPEVVWVVWVVQVHACTVLCYQLALDDRQLLCCLHDGCLYCASAAAPNTLGHVIGVQANHDTASRSTTQGDVKVHLKHCKRMITGKGAGCCQNASWAQELLARASPYLLLDGRLVVGGLHASGQLRVAWQEWRSAWIQAYQPNFW